MLVNLKWNSKRVHHNKYLYLIIELY